MRQSSSTLQPSVEVSTFNLRYQVDVSREPDESSGDPSVSTGRGYSDGTLAGQLID